MESLCSPGRGSARPRCGDPTGEGEAARASSTAGNDSGIIWVLTGMQELLRTHSGCEPALPGPWNIGVWISTGSGWAPCRRSLLHPCGSGCTPWPQSSQCLSWWPGTDCGSHPCWLGAAPSSQQLQPGTQSQGSAPGSSLEQHLAAEIP